MNTQNLSIVMSGVRLPWQPNLLHRTRKQVSCYKMRIFLHIYCEKFDMRGEGREHTNCQKQKSQQKYNSILSF